MRVGINGYEAVVPRFGYDAKTNLPLRVGSSKYSFELLVNLYKIDKKNDYIIYLPQNPTSDLPKVRENWHYKLVGPRKLWTLFGLSLEFLFGGRRVDVFFSPTHYLPIFTPSCSAISILDVSYIHFPEFFKTADLRQLTLWTRYSVRKAKKIFTISRASKDDIIKIYKIPSDRVVVTYPGIKMETQNLKLKTQNLKDKFGMDKDYILFVGTLQPRKNIIRLVEAFSTLDNKNISLVIVGKKGWLYKEILSSPKKFGAEERVKFLDFVSDEDLPNLYKNAVCFVLPSLYEGFGLPVLEAMKYGCPVIISNVSSLPEAGGDAALYVNPLDVDDIAKKIKSVLENPNLRKELIDKGYKQVKKFNWEKTAKETLKVLEGIGSNKH